MNQLMQIWKMAFCVNSNNLTIMGVQCYFQNFDCFKYFLFFYVKK